jgi:hypothetical protein
MRMATNRNGPRIFQLGFRYRYLDFSGGVPNAFNFGQFRMRP